MAEGPIATIIREKLTAALAPTRLEIEDDSARHAGHHHEGGMDAKPGGESHFNLTVVSAAFEGKNAINRQRLVYKCIWEEMQSERVHAVQGIETKTPAEAAK